MNMRSTLFLTLFHAFALVGTAQQRLPSTTVQTMEAVSYTHLLQEAAALIQQADRLLVVGTSLQVYPAAGLLQVTRSKCHIVLVDPGVVEVTGIKVTHIRSTAVNGVPALVAQWLRSA